MGVADENDEYIAEVKENGFRVLKRQASTFLESIDHIFYLRISTLSSVVICKYT